MPSPWSIAHIDGLAVVTKPVTKVDTLNIKLGELLIGSTAGENGEEGIFDITFIYLSLYTFRR
jgi:hypothetical protein